MCITTTCSKTMKELVDASSHSRIFRSVLFLLFFSIFFVTTTNGQPLVMHRRLWPWPTWRPFPMTQPRPWPMDPPEPAPSPNPCPPPPPTPQPKPPGPEPCPPPKPQPKPPTPGPEPCPPPKPQPKPPAPGPEPCPPPKPQPKPAPGPEPCPPTPPKPQPKPHPAPDAGPEPSPCPPKPPAPGPNPMPPPGPKPPKPEKVDISAVFFFGDSIFDTGNNNDRRKAKMKSNFRPYGINFKDGVATGRFGNGKVSSDYIAKYMGIKKLVPAYLDKKMKPDDLLTGVSFASGGSGYIPKTSKATLYKSESNIPMLEQLTYFQDYIEKVNKLVKEENTEDILSGSSDKANKMLSKGVAVVSGGGNDLVNTFFGDKAQRLKKDIDSFTTMMADSAASFVLQLYEYGAKRIGVVGLPPLGCAPLERKKRKKKCNKKLNYASQLFNSKLLIILGQLSKSLQNSTFVYMDVYTIMSQMIETPKDFGFEEIRKPCCKTGSLFKKGLLCKKRTSKICSNTSAYLYWDGIHPTKRALKTINKVIVKEYLPLLTKR